MSYQLPQEVQTQKLNSLPADAKALAEELIAEKFGYGEVMKGNYGGDPRFLDPAQDFMERNMLQGELVTYNRRIWRFVIPMNLSLSWDRRYAPSRETSITSSQVIHEMVNRVKEQMDKFNSLQAGRNQDYRTMSGASYAISNDDPVQQMTLELNGQRRACSSMQDIYRFIETNLYYSGTYMGEPIL